MQENKILNPFPGIRSFEPEEDFIFFGRETQISEIIKLLLDTHFVAVIGSSGCGKSSLVRAGVIPSLLKDKNYPDLNLAMIRPGNRALENLSTALFSGFREKSISLEGIKSAAELYDYLGKSPDALMHLFQENPALKDQKWLIFIDQFEELFRFEHSGDNKKNEHTEAFIRLLLKSISQSDLPVYFLLSMRSDFIDHCSTYEGLIEHINQGHYLVPNMLDEEKKRAIIKPIEAFDAKISDKLVDTLLADLSNEPDHLPVLQHALMRTWDYWQKNKIGGELIDIKHYEAIGTMDEALSIHGEEIYAEMISREDKLITEKIFKALTDLSSGNKGTRRPTALKEIAALSGASVEQVRIIIDKFRAQGRTFLMPGYKKAIKEDSIIDISHESLMRVWKRLRQWVVEETASAQLYLRLANSARLYQEGKSGLLVNPELELALKWREENHPNAIWAARYDPAFNRAIEFLNYSKDEFDREVNRKEKKQKKELRRARFFAVFLGFASLVSLLFLIISLNMRIQAQASEKKALEKEKLALEESKKAEEQRKEAILQSKIAEQQQEISEQQKLITEEQKEFAVEQQNIALQQKQIALRQKLKAEKQEGIALNQKKIAEEQKEYALSQKQIAEKERKKAQSSEQNALRLRKLAVARSVAIQASELSKSVEGNLPAMLAINAWALNQSNQGRENDPDIYKALLDVDPVNNAYRMHDDAVRKVLCSSDGKYLFSCGDDAKVFMTDLSKGQNKLFSTGGQAKSALRSLALTRNSRFLAAANNKGEIFIWDINEPGKAFRIINGHSDVIYDMAFTNDQKKLISAGGDGKLLLWDFQSAAQAKTIYSGDARILALSTFENKVYFSDDQGVVRSLLLGDDVPESKMIIKRNNAVTALDLSPDGSYLGLGTNNGVLVVVDLQSGNISELIGHSSGITSLQFSPDNKQIASSAYDGSIRIWDYKNTDAQPLIISKHDAWVYAVDYDPAGDYIYSASADKTLGKWPARSELVARQICKEIDTDLSKEQWNKYFGTDIEKENACSKLK